VGWVGMSGCHLLLHGTAASCNHRLPRSLCCFSKCQRQGHVKLLQRFKVTQNLLVHRLLLAQSWALQAPGTSMETACC